MIVMTIIILDARTLSHSFSVFPAAGLLEQERFKSTLTAQLHMPWEIYDKLSQYFLSESWWEGGAGEGEVLSFAHHDMPLAETEMAPSWKLPLTPTGGSCFSDPQTNSQLGKGR